MPPNLKRMFFAYTATATGLYALYNYNDGKNALFDYRASAITPSPAKEWAAIREGINYVSNFFDALFFPMTISNQVMPSLILWMNPR
jgi:hypothetical protein